MIQVEDIIHYAREGALLFHSPGGTAYAAVEVDGHLETHAIRSVRFKDWILMRFLRQHGRAPNSQLLNDALNTIRAIAVYHGLEMPVFVRVAEHEGAIYIDLGNENWDAVRVTPEGYEVVSRPPVAFVRKAGFAPLPYPDGGTVDDIRPFLNVGSDGDFMLVAAWAAFSLSPQGPFPVLVLQGEQGSAKSTTVRVLRALVGPAVEPLRALPKHERDLAIAAANAWVLAFDNLSGIRDQLSDALCRLATGGGFATRQLYTDDEEIIFSAKRPIILNGIDDLATRSDLQERSLLVSLPSIPEERRVEEAAFWAARRLSPPQTTPQARNPSPWRWPASSRSLGSLCGPCGGWSRRSGSRRRLWPSRAQHRWPSWWRKVSSRCSNLCATCIGFMIPNSTLYLECY